MEKKELYYIEDKGILRLALKRRGITQAALAEKMEVKQNTLSMNMSRIRMSLSMFTRILDKLDYDVVVVDRKTGEAEWKVELD